MMKKLICFGDSMVFGYLVSRSDAWVTLLNSPPALQAVNRGGNGDTTLDLLRRFGPHVLDADADALLLLAGTNDFLQGIRLTDTLNHLMYMIRRAQGEGLTVFLSTITPYCTKQFEEELRFFGDFSRAESLRREFNDAVRSYPECIDCAERFESLPEDELPQYYIDGVHLNPAGHRLMAERIRRHLRLLEA